jgi:alkanesulfonate monooxygenase
MSGGRVELGIGAGWYEREHAAYGFPFPDVAERFDVLEDQLAIITGLWATDPSSGVGFTYEGKQHAVVDSPGLPKPHQAKPPIIMGGSGRRRSAALAARYADEYNLAFQPFEAGLPVLERVKAACEEAGRDPATLITSSALVLCVGKDEAEFRRRAENIGQDPETLRAEQLGGTVSEVLDKIGRYAGSGQTRLYLQTLDLQDLDHLELVASEVMPHV